MSLGNRWTKLWESHMMESDTDVVKGTHSRGELSRISKQDGKVCGLRCHLSKGRGPTFKYVCTILAYVEET